MIFGSLIKDTVDKFHRSYGFYVDTKAVYVTQIVAEFKGTRVEKSIALPLDGKTLADCIQTIFPNAVPQIEDTEETTTIFTKKKEKKKIKLGEIVKSTLEKLPDILEVGVKDISVFYYAFATSTKHGKKLDIDAIINESPKAEFLHSTNLTYDWMTTQIGDQGYILICATKKNLVHDTWKEFDKFGFMPVRMEAGTWAALRAAWHFSPPAFRKAEIRVIAGPEMSLVALNIGSLPIAWQLLQTDSSQFIENIFPSVQSFILYTQRQLNMSSVEHIILQGENLTEEMRKKLADMSNANCKLAPCKPYDGHLISFGLALGALDPEAKAINLTREFQKPIPILTVFPYMESILATVMVFFTLLYLWTQTGKIEKIVRLQNMMSSQIIWAQNMSNDAIQSDNNAMMGQISPLIDFYAPRVPWFEILEELSNILPPKSRIINLDAKDGVWVKKTKDSTGLTITVNIKEDSKRGPIAEMELFMDALKDSAILTAYFPKVTLVSVALAPSGTEITARVLFST